jgi:hypothetical protein
MTHRQLSAKPAMLSGACQGSIAQLVGVHYNALLGISLTRTKTQATYAKSL